MTVPLDELHVNGKWLAQKLTGTQRYASEMVRAIAASGRARLVLHVPRGADVPGWVAHHEVDVKVAPVAGVLFEQIYLPAATARRMLLNFAGPAPLLKRKQLVTMHDATPFRYPETFTKRFVAFYYVMYSVLGRLARHLVTVSHFSAGELEEVLHIPRERFIVAECSANTLAGVSETRPDLALPERFYLVVGTLAVNKNLRRPIMSVADSGRDVVVVGLAGDQQVYSATGSLAGHAIIPGWLSDSELVWLYRNAVALIFPSKYEGFGLPPLEAQMLGCVVVSSDAAALPEVCGDGAVYFDPDDPAALIAELAELEGSDVAADELRRRGAKNAARFSWASSADKVLNGLGVR